MKKLLLLLSIVLVSCDASNNRKVVQPNVEETSTYGAYIVELTAKNKTHEYILYQFGRNFGMTHLPECKYCEKVCQRKQYRVVP